MTVYAHRAAVLDRLLAELSIEPHHVLSADVAPAPWYPVDTTLHISHRVDGLDYQPTDGASHHLQADVEREDLTIRVFHVITDEETQA